MFREFCVDRTRKRGKIKRKFLVKLWKAMLKSCTDQYVRNWCVCLGFQAYSRYEWMRGAKEWGMRRELKFFKRMAKCTLWACLQNPCHNTHQKICIGDVTIPERLSRRWHWPDCPELPEHLVKEDPIVVASLHWQKQIQSILSTLITDKILVDAFCKGNLYSCVECRASSYQGRVERSLFQWQETKKWQTESSNSFVWRWCVLHHSCSLEKFRHCWMVYLAGDGKQGKKF